jgi:hypothetical protein
VTLPWKLRVRSLVTKSVALVPVSLESVALSTMRVMSMVASLLVAPTAILKSSLALRPPWSVAVTRTYTSPALLGAPLKVRVAGLNCSQVGSVPPLTRLPLASTCWAV